MPKLFPIGDLSGGSSSGTIDSISYSMFEPNNGCTTTPIYSILTNLADDKIMATRKKTDSYITVKYQYDNILDREYKQIEHFTDDVDEALTPFYVVSWDRGITPSNVTGTTTLTVSIPITRYFSIIANNKCNMGFLWSGSQFALGAIATVTTNTSIAMAKTYGNLSATIAAAKAVLYPVYTGYISPGALQSFSKTEFIDEAKNPSSYGGFMRSGEISFIGKYKSN